MVVPLVGQEGPGRSLLLIDSAIRKPRGDIIGRPAYIICDPEQKARPP
jgi:hypothetical protein